MTQSQVLALMKQKGFSPNLKSFSTQPASVTPLLTYSAPQGQSLYRYNISFSPVDHEVYMISVTDITPDYPSDAKIDQLKTAGDHKWGASHGMDYHGRHVDTAWGDENGVYASFNIADIPGVWRDRGSLVVQSAPRSKLVSDYIENQGRLPAPSV